MSHCGRRPVLGVFIPEFPGQTHGFFWRELSLLEQSGLAVEIVSTRLPPSSVEARHDWSVDAHRRTRYLTPLGIAGMVSVLTEAFLMIDRWIPLVRASFGLSATSIAGRARILALTFIAIRLRRVCRRRNIRHMHVHSCGECALLAALCRVAGGPSYSLVLHSPIDCFGGNQPAKWRGAEFGVVVSECVGRELAQLHAADLPAETLVSSMGFDETVYQRSTPYRPWRPGEMLRLAACSRVTKGKGIDVLIEMVASLRASGIDVRLQIAGGGGNLSTGGLCEDLDGLVNRLGVADQVEFLGSCDAARIRDMLHESHVFVTATRQEAIGVAIMEAMAMGLPVVATRVGGIPELIEDDRSGVLVPVDSPGAMADSIRAIIMTPSRAVELGSAAAARVGREFTSRRSAERLMAVLARRHPELMARSPEASILP